MAEQRDSIQHTLLIALGVSLVCSVVVAAAAILLEPRRELNEQKALRFDVLDVAGRLDATRSINDAFAEIETRLVDLSTGEFVAGDPADFDARRAARDAQLGIAIPTDKDKAHIKRRAKLGKVYVVRDGTRVERIVLPVHGYGLWSTMYGFIAIAPDAREILALKFYEHAETPGLGDQIEDPKWLASWHGTRIFDANGEVAVEVVKGAVRSNDPMADYRIDGLTGATLTGRGVSNAVRYWLGEHGYGPFLEKLRSEDGT